MYVIRMCLGTRQGWGRAHDYAPGGRIGLCTPSRAYGHAAFPGNWFGSSGRWGRTPCIHGMYAWLILHACSAGQTANFTSC